VFVASFTTAFIKTFFLILNGPQCLLKVEGSDAQFVPVDAKHLLARTKTTYKHSKFE